MFNRQGYNRCARLIHLLELYIADCHIKRALGQDVSTRLVHLENRYNNWRGRWEKAVA